MIFSNVISLMYGQAITLHTILQDPVSAPRTPMCSFSDSGVCFTLSVHFLPNIGINGFRLSFPLFLSITSCLLLLLFSTSFLTFPPLPLLPFLFLITSWHVSFPLSDLLSSLFGLCLSQGPKQVLKCLLTKRVCFLLLIFRENLNASHFSANWEKES